MLNKSVVDKYGRFKITFVIFDSVVDVFVKVPVYKVNIVLKAVKHNIVNNLLAN